MRGIPGFIIRPHESRDNEVCVQLFFKDYWGKEISLAWVFTDKSIKDVLEDKSLYQGILFEAIEENIKWETVDDGK